MCRNTEGLTQTSLSLLCDIGFTFALIGSPRVRRGSIVLARHSVPRVIAALN